MTKFKKRHNDKQSFPVKESGDKKDLGYLVNTNLAKSKKVDDDEMLDFAKEKSDGVDDDGHEIHKTKVWSFDKASEDLKEKILENWRDNNIGDDTFYAEDEGILYDTKENFAGYDVFKNVIPKFWDLDNHGASWIQFELETTDESKLAKYLGIPEKLRNKIDIHFENERENNTEIFFTDIMGNRIDLSEDIHSYDNKDNFYDVSEEDKPTINEFRLLLQAHDKWADLMDSSLEHLKNNYEYQFEDESIIDTIEANDYRFNSDGDIVNG